MELTIRRLSKRFGDCRALDEVTLSLGGGVTAILGSNGAGKSTLLRVLATLLRPDSGEIAFDGRPYRNHLRTLRGTLGYLPPDLELPGHMTPLAFLRHMAQFKLLPSEANIPALLRALGLTAIAERPFSALSGGQMRLVGTAQAFLGPPRLTLLDEPTKGLDVQERERVFRLIRQPVLGRSILFSTHLPDEAASIAEQVVVLRQGRVLYAGSVDDLLKRVQGRVWERPLLPQGVVERLPDQQVFVSYRRNESRLRIVGPVSLDHGAVPVPATLEDAYLLLQREAENSPARLLLL